MAHWKPGLAGLLGILTLSAQSIQGEVSLGTVEVRSNQQWTSPWTPPTYLQDPRTSGNDATLPNIRHFRVGVLIPQSARIAWRIGGGVSNLGGILRCRTFGASVVASPPHDEATSWECTLGLGFSRLDGYEAVRAPQWRWQEQPTGSPIPVLENPQDLRRLRRTCPTLMGGLGLQFASGFGVELFVERSALPTGTGPNEFSSCPLVLGGVRLGYRFPRSKR